MHEHGSDPYANPFSADADGETATAGGGRGAADSAAPAQPSSESAPVVERADEAGEGSAHIDTSAFADIVTQVVEFINTAKRPTPNLATRKVRATCHPHVLYPLGIAYHPHCAQYDYGGESNHEIGSPARMLRPIPCPLSPVPYSLSPLFRARPPTPTTCRW